MLQNYHSLEASPVLVDPYGEPCPSGEYGFAISAAACSWSWEIGAGAERATCNPDLDRCFPRRIRDDCGHTASRQFRYRRGENTSFDNLPLDFHRGRVDRFSDRGLGSNSLALQFRRRSFASCRSERTRCADNRGSYIRVQPARGNRAFVASPAGGVNYRRAHFCPCCRPNLVCKKDMPQWQWSGKRASA